MDVDVTSEVRALQEVEIVADGIPKLQQYEVVRTPTNAKATLLSI